MPCLLPFYYSDADFMPKITRKQVFFIFGAPYAWKLEPIHAGNSPNRPDDRELRAFGTVAQGGIVRAGTFPGFPVFNTPRGTRTRKGYRLSDKNKVRVRGAKSSKTTPPRRTRL